MFTDIAGYTSLSQRNEKLALQLLEEHRSLLRPFFPRHAGKEIKTIGDAFLVEFASALEAVRCAFEMQQSLHERNAINPPGRKVTLRIGIHLGDVVHNQNDVYGDAVNIASRIEPLADPGGISLTEQVYDHVKNKFEFPIVSAGRREVKNVDAPLEVYKVVLPWEERGSSVGPEDFDRRRVAVLPFANISPDPNDEYFADGMTEELISAISKIPELTVISRTSVMKYKGGGRSIQEIRPELKVGTMLEGSVRKAGTKVRISVQLIDANKEGHLWAENYNRELQDVFEVQSDIAHKVAESLKVRLLARDAERVAKVPTADMEAYTLYLKGRFFWNERTLAGVNKAIRYFEEAIRHDPGYALAYAGLADCYTILENWSFLKPQEAAPKTKEYSKKALEIDDTLAEAHTSMAVVWANSWEWERAESEYRRAIELNPNDATAHHWYGHGVLEALKRYDEAISELKEAQKLDPFSLIIATNLGDALLAARRMEGAIEQYRSILETDPNFAYAHARLGMALAASSAFEEAIAEAEKSWSLSPENVETKAILAYVYFAAGRREAAERILEEMKEIAKTRYVTPALFAEVYSALGKRDQAFEWLDRAAETRSSTLVMNLSEPQFDPCAWTPGFGDWFNESIWNDAENGKNFSNWMPRRVNDEVQGWCGPSSERRHSFAFVSG